VRDAHAVLAKWTICTMTVADRKMKLSCVLPNRPGPACAAVRSQVAGTLPRTRLLTELTDAAEARLRLVSGPAGAGKSVLLRQLAVAEADRPGRLGVRCAGDGGLVAALATELGSPARTTGELLTALRDHTVYVDDTHTIAGGPDARVLARLVAEAPPGVRFVVATRDDRLLRTADVPGPVQHIGYRDLRFAADDVARLFATVYRGPLSDAAAEALCERVEGLPVALRMLHLDTTLLRPPARAAAFADPLAGSERLREFLTRDVLGALPEPLRDFMVDVSPFGVLDPALCAALLGRSDSAEVLAELTARNALTFRVGADGPTYRFHVLLQQFLEPMLVTRRGTHLARQAHHGAATHLAGAGHWAEAYRGYARAGDWVAAARVVHRLGAGEHGPRASASVPRTLFDDDPWVALAEARRLRGDGRFAEAYDRYLSAEERLPDRRLRWQCSLERSAIAPWTLAGQQGEPLVDDVSWHVAAAVRGQPARLVAQAVPVASPEWTLGRAVAAMLDGRARLAIDLAAPLAVAGGTFVPLAARLMVAAVTAWLHGQGTVAVFADLAADAEAAGWLWVARLARAATALLDIGACADAAAILAHCEEHGDEWGALLAAYLLTVGLLRAGRPVLPDVVAAAVARARRLGALVPEAWLRVVLVDDLTRRDQPGAAVERAELDRLWGAEVLGPVRHERAEALAALSAPPEPPESPQLVLAPPVVERPPPVAVRCLGAFEFVVAGVPVDLDGLRAQARCVLRVLCMQYGQPMHEERLVAALWPDAPLKRAKHRLQVAISSLRALLRPHLGGSGGVLRHGSAYVLALPPGSTVDVVDFASAVRRWRAGRHAGDPARVRALAGDVLDRYRGELLVEEGAAEWVLTRRESIRGEAAGVAVALATFELAQGDVAAAIEVCERTLAIDELDHRLWTLLAEARHRAGDPAAAVRATKAYRSLVAEA
jgi:DNA-binding SARP family transcriptional activator/Mrp family chromosome partitioning ATPase